MNLLDVYSVDGHISILYELLKERTKEQSISHKQLPVFAEHCLFVASKPYKAWYFIANDAGLVVGAVYLTKYHDKRFAGEIGLFISDKEKGKGYGTAAVNMLREKHEGEIIANVSPENEEGNRFWSKFGKIVQVSYVLE